MASDHLLPGCAVAQLRGYLERADTALSEGRREDMVMALSEMAGFLATELDAPQEQRSAPLDQIGRLCRAMNPGTPGWHLRDQILAVLRGDGR